MKHRSYFLRCGIEREMSFICRRTGSAAAACAGDAAPGGTPFGGCDVEEALAFWVSTLRRFEEGSSSEASDSRPYTKLAMSLKRLILAGESGKLSVVSQVFCMSSGNSHGKGARLDSARVSSEKTRTCSVLDAGEYVGAGLEDKAEPLSVKS